LAEKKSGKGRKLKCPICNKLNLKEDTELFKKRYYCKGECIEDILSQQKKKDQNQEDWNELYEYIIELYGHKPTGIMFKQLGDFRKDPYNYTNKGMYLTLKYFYGIKGQSVLEDAGLGIIPYVYEEAKKNFLEQREVSEYNIEHESNEKIERVKINRRKNKNKERLIGSIINFDDLDKELEDGWDEE
jgi:hypothetical protein